LLGVPRLLLELGAAELGTTLEPLRLLLLAAETAATKRRRVSGSIEKGRSKKRGSFRCKYPATQPGGECRFSRLCFNNRSRGDGIPRRDSRLSVSLVVWHDSSGL
jgi:hypothetical protein